MDHNHGRDGKEEKNIIPIKLTTNPSYGLCHSSGVRVHVLAVALDGDDHGHGVAAAGG
jgi:hypothetical protein